MALGIYFREPRLPRELYGPFTIEQLRELVRQGRLRPTDQVSFDRQSWLSAADFEPNLFSGAAGGDERMSGWQRGMARFADFLKVQAIAVWNFLRLVALFYWNERKELWQLAADYLPFLTEQGTRREIRVSAQDHNKAVFLEDGQWHANLPDCCVVCGEPADCNWNDEHRSVPDLTWPLFAPIYGLGLGLAIWIFFWQSTFRWFLPLGLLLGFLFGYGKRGDTLVAVRFRRCREHLNRTRLPSLRTFRRTLAIGVGDRKVWRAFYYGDIDLETPMTVPPDFSAIVDSKRHTSPWPPRPSPTIPLADSDHGEHD